ncbi:helix-turn-helix domain-containing protein [Embleya sp. NPDC020886]|uniref:helix-turn-helix domain-containing protein n=1 Tax=Embleya sp. NPDC020886 TaxID=3363980 RepID=UPI00379C4B79
MTSDFQQARVSLGARLRELRTEADPTGREIARRLGWPPSKVSKLETGRQTPTGADLDAWAQVVGRPHVATELKARLSGFETTYRTWKRQLAAEHRLRQEAGIVEMRRTRALRGFEAGVIPGIFQTADYARHAELRRTPRDIEAAVGARMRRQDFLYEPGRQIHALVWEAALRVRVCPHDVLVGQLDRLGGVLGLNSVSLGIVPFNADLSVAPGDGFWIYDDRLVITETWTAEMWLEDADSLALFTTVWDSLNESAAYGRAAQRLSGSSHGRRPRFPPAEKQRVTFVALGEIRRSTPGSEKNRRLPSVSGRVR